MRHIPVPLVVPMLKKGDTVVLDHLPIIRTSAHAMHSCRRCAPSRPGAVRFRSEPDTRAFEGNPLTWVRCAFQCARMASSSSATMLVIFMAGLTAGPAVSL